MIKINLDIILLVLSIIAFLYFAVSNLIKRFRFLENKLFILSNLSASAAHSILLYELIYYNDVDLTELTRYFFALLMLTHLFSFIILQVFPRWEKRRTALFIVSSAIPGLAAIVLTVFSDLVISNTNYKAALINQYGKFSFVFVIVYAIYFLCMIILTLHKSKSLENDSFRMQLSSMNIIISAGTIFFAVLYIALPVFFNIYKYAVIGVIGFNISTNFIINYSLSDEKRINIIKFYLRIAIWIVIFAVLFLPVYLFIEAAMDQNIIRNNTAVIAGSLIIPFLLIVLYRILRHAADKIINKKDRLFAGIFNKISYNISELTDMRKQKMEWDIFFQKGIYAVCEMLNIEKASFFLLNEESRNFEPVYSNVETRGNTGIPESDEIIKILGKNKQIIIKSLFYADYDLWGFKDILLEFFNRNSVDAVLPLFTGEDRLTAVLLFGGLPDKRHYSTDFIALLDSYRVQFSDLLENLLFSEKIRRAQVVKRDKMVVKNIKKRIIPARFMEMEGFKISSLFINNSDFGGDYFDSAKIHTDKVGIYAANTSDAGVESVLLALQMSSIFHSQADVHESPEGLLNTVNQVLCTSRFTERYATALYMIYNVSKREIAFSNAAFNPLVIFNPKKESFVEFDAEGIPIGIDIESHYKYSTMPAPSDGIGLCYSPGLSSAIDRNGNNYSISRIKDIIRNNKNDTPAMLIRKIYNDFNDFADTKLLNDVTLIIFKTA